LTFEIQLPRGEGIDIFDRFNTATFISIFQRRTWISFLRSMIWGESWLFLLLILAGFLTRVTRRISLVEQELATLPEHLRSPPVFSGVRFARSFVFCVLLDRCLVFFVLFLLVIVFSVFLRFPDSYYPVGISGFLLPGWYLRILITRLVSQDSYFPVGISGFLLPG
jgi:hypothetical protein